MAYREDLDAAHARIDALEAELAEARAEIQRLMGVIDNMRTSKVAEQRERQQRDHEKEDQRRLREKMDREQREVEAAVADALRADDD